MCAWLSDYRGLDGRRHGARLLAVSALATGLAGCASPPTGKQLSAAEIRSTLVGNTEYGVTSSGVAFTTYAASDGTAKLSAGSFADRGTWRIVDDRGTWRITDDGHWCSKWQHLRGGAEACSSVVQDGDKIEFVGLNGAHSSTVRVKPGNPETCRTSDMCAWLSDYRGLDGRGWCAVARHRRGGGEPRRMRFSAHREAALSRGNPFHGRRQHRVWL